MAYIFRIDLKAWGETPEAISEKFETARAVFEKGLSRSVSLGAEVLERDYADGSADNTWKCRDSLHPDISPDVF